MVYTMVLQWCTELIYSINGRRSCQHGRNQPRGRWYEELIFDDSKDPHQPTNVIAAVWT